MTDSVVVEGYVRFRDGKKWKTRWVVLRKPSPVADCLLLLVFKDKSDKARGHAERASVTLEDICGLEVRVQGLEGAPYTLAVLCLSQAAILGFDSKDTLLAWEVRIRYSLGEVHRFNVGVLPGTKLEGGPATLHLCNNLLALARDTPPVVIGHWNLPDLRRYGPVPSGFVFEGGTRCGYWAGVFFVASAESEHISFLFDCIVRGVSPTRSPFGLQPVLPGQHQAAVQAEEKVNQEAQELERRVSLLSHHYSTASSVYAPSAGDDRSISGSSDASDTSQSDGSIGSRLTVWAEPGPAPGPALCPGLGPGASTTAASPIGFARLTMPSVERLSISHGGGAGGGGSTRPAAKPPRQLQEIGRQHSSDSGIATTGSHSSYSGSFSSYTGSLDGASGEEYTPSAGPTLASPPQVAVDLPSACTCNPLSALGHDYQVPTSLRRLYDAPKSVAKDDDNDEPHPTATPTPTTATTPTLLTWDCVPITLSPPPHPLAESVKAGVGVVGSLSPPPPHPELVQSGESRRSRVALPGDSCQTCTSKTVSAICATCGGYKGPTYSPTSGHGIPAIPENTVNSKEEDCRGDPAYEVMERNSEAEEKAKYEPLGSGGPLRFLQEPEGAFFAFPPEGPVPEKLRLGDGVTYVNIPISPTSKKQLNYMELEIQEAGGPSVRGSGSTKYAHIDITATETAHKVGTQHALGREEGLHTLELRRRGAPQ
ncbi:unnamed protein product [Merluccius merluccius]